MTLHRFSKSDATTLSRQPIDLTEHDLRQLFLNNLDSAYYLNSAPESAVQRLYQALLDRQLGLLDEVVGALEGAGVAWACVQGAEATLNLFHGQAFGRRSDIDLLVSDDTIAIAQKVLFGHGLEQIALTPDTLQPVPLDSEHAARIAETRHAGKVYPFAQIERLDLPEDVAALVPRVLKPMFRRGRDVMALVSIEMGTQCFEGADTNAILGAAERHKGLNFLSMNVNFLLSAKRLCDSLGDGDPRLRLLCELAVRKANGLHDAQLAEDAARWNLTRTLTVANTFIDAATSDPGCDEATRRLGSLFANP